MRQQFKHHTVSTSQYSRPLYLSPLRTRPMSKCSENDPYSQIFTQIKHKIINLSKSRKNKGNDKVSCNELHQKQFQNRKQLKIQCNKTKNYKKQQSSIQQTSYLQKKQEKQTFKLFQNKYKKQKQVKRQNINIQKSTFKQLTINKMKQFSFLKNVLKKIDNLNKNNKNNELNQLTQDQKQHSQQIVRLYMDVMKALQIIKQKTIEKNDNFNHQITPQNLIENPIKNQLFSQINELINIINRNPNILNNNFKHNGKNQSQHNQNKLKYTYAQNYSDTSSATRPSTSVHNSSYLVMNYLKDRQNRAKNTNKSSHIQTLQNNKTKHTKFYSECDQNSNLSYINKKFNKKQRNGINNLVKCQTTKLHNRNSIAQQYNIKSSADQYLNQDQSDLIKLRNSEPYKNQELQIQFKKSLKKKISHFLQDTNEFQNENIKNRLSRKDFGFVTLKTVNFADSLWKENIYQKQCQENNNSRSEKFLKNSSQKSLNGKQRPTSRKRIGFLKEQEELRGSGLLSRNKSRKKIQGDQQRKSAKDLNKRFKSNKNRLRKGFVKRSDKKFQFLPQNVLDLIKLQLQQDNQQKNGTQSNSESSQSYKLIISQPLQNQQQKISIASIQDVVQKLNIQSNLSIPMQLPKQSKRQSLPKKQNEDNSHRSKKSKQSQQSNKNRFNSSNGHGNFLKRNAIIYKQGYLDFLTKKQDNIMLTMYPDITPFSQLYRLHQGLQSHPPFQYTSSFYQQQQDLQNVDDRHYASYNYINSLNNCNNNKKSENIGKQVQIDKNKDRASISNNYNIFQLSHHRSSNSGLNIKNYQRSYSFMADGQWIKLQLQGRKNLEGLAQKGLNHSSSRKSIQEIQAI